MDITKPLNDQPVELTLSYESVMKIESAIDQLKDSLAGKRRELINNKPMGYSDRLIAECLLNEVDYLKDLQRALTMRMDNVADDYKLAKSPEFPEFVEPIPTCVRYNLDN